MAEQERKRDTQINIRLTELELDMLEAIEESTGENKSVIVRRLIRREHKQCK